MTDHLLALIAAHFACSDMAATRPLSIGEVEHCAAVYHEIKLSFVPGIDADAYVRLSPEKKMATNKEGFLAFLAWRAAHPGLVAHLEDVAQGKTTLAISG